MRNGELLTLSILPAWRGIKLWWLESVERYYLMSAEVEQRRAKEANSNARFYHNRAANVRASINSLRPNR